MKIKKTRSARLNLGNYEHIEVYASMELDSEIDASLFESFGGDETKAMNYIDDQLITFMQDDVYQAKRVTTNGDSAAFRLYDLNYNNTK